MSETKVGEFNYQIGKLSAKQQWHIAKRLLTAAGKNKKDATIFEAVASMDDADSDFIIDTCLSVCQRQQGVVFAPVGKSGALMFQDIQMAEMLQLTSAVITENLGSFFPGAPAGNTAATKA